jgi:hypothetical protein
VRFTTCAICGERFCRIDADFRAGRVTSWFCSDCIDAVHSGKPHLLASRQTYAADAKGTH